MAQSINKTTQSSKLDWADVIGDEIESLEKIENLQDIEVTDETQESEDGDSSTSKLSEKIEELKSSLSSELKLYASERMRPKAKNVLRQSIERLGFVAQRGFADDRWDGLRDPNRLNEGEKITIKLGDHRDRIATLCAYDDEGNYLGSFINNSEGEYGEFSTAVCQVMGSCTFSGEIVDVDDRRPSSQRTYFTVKCFPISDAKG